MVMKNILEDNISTKAEDIILGSLDCIGDCATNCLPVTMCPNDSLFPCKDDMCPLNCGTGDKVCVKADSDIPITGCTALCADDCPLHNLCDSYNPDPCLDGVIVTGCTSNYVYSDCTTDATIATRAMFNVKINNLKFFTDDVTRMATKGDIDEKTTVDSSFNIKDNYKSFQGVRLRDIGILCFSD
jgi:hypothetical protein